MPRPDEIIRHYGLEPHPEGGFYRRTYCSAGKIPAAALPCDFSGDRPYGTAILYLLGPNDKSCLHRIKQDETWHFYLGGPLHLVMLNATGELTEVILGQDIMRGQQVQYTVPKNTWFGAKPLPASSYALVGCTVTPGFDFADFEMGDHARLSERFPQHKNIIASFCN